MVSLITWTSPSISSGLNSYGKLRRSGICKNEYQSSQYCDAAQGGQRYSIHGSGRMKFLTVPCNTVLGRKSCLLGSSISTKPTATIFKPKGMTKVCMSDDKDHKEDGPQAPLSVGTVDSKETPTNNESSKGAGGGGKGPEDDKEQERKDKIMSDQLSSYTVLELLSPPKVDPDDVKLLRERLFGYTTYWVTGQEPFGEGGQGVLLLGNLRGNREEVFAKLQEGLRETFPDNRYDLFMVEEPSAEDEDPRGGPRVSFVLLRKEVSEGSPITLWQYIVAALLFVITVGASLELGLASQISRLPPDIVSYFTSPDSASLPQPDVEQLVPFVEAALPVAYGVLGVQLLHELGHRLAASQYRVKLGIPYLVPNVTLGTFGAVTEFKSVLPSRIAKFDISIAGPMAATLLSCTMMAMGLHLSQPGDPSGVLTSNDLVQVPSLLFQGSVLLGSLSRAALGYEAMHSATVAIHPLLIAGWCGLTTTALNLLPVGCLDGGRCMQAAFGKSALNVSGLITYLLLGLAVLGGTLSLPFGLYVLILQRNQEKPALNDVSGVGGIRQGVFMGMLMLVFLTLLPMWDSLSENLGIGLGSTVF